MEPLPTSGIVGSGDLPTSGIVGSGDRRDFISSQETLENTVGLRFGRFPFTTGQVISTDQDSLSMYTWTVWSWRTVLQPTEWLSPVYVNDIIHWKTDQVFHYQVSSCTVHTKVTLDKVFNHPDGKGLKISGNSKCFEGPVLNCRVKTTHSITGGLTWHEWVIVVC